MGDREVTHGMALGDFQVLLAGGEPIEQCLIAVLLLAVLLVAVYYFRNGPRRASEPWVPLEPKRWGVAGSNRPSCDLADYDGSVKNRPTLLSATGLVFDVTESGAYALGMGCDTTICPLFSPYLLLVYSLFTQHGM